MLWSTEGCIVTNGINWFQIPSQSAIDCEKDVDANVNKTIRDIQYESGVDKLGEDFDIIHIMDNLRINKIVHELILTK